MNGERIGLLYLTVCRHPVKGVQSPGKIVVRGGLERV
jgi:hypothetical protein